MEKTKLTTFFRNRPVGPNPFVERLLVTLSVQLRAPMFRLCDASGRMIREQRLSVGINELDTSGLPNGAYFWEIMGNGERVKAGKLLK